VLSVVLLNVECSDRSCPVQKKHSTFNNQYVNTQVL
jgi:hypothetical protein